MRLSNRLFVICTIVFIIISVGVTQLLAQGPPSQPGPPSRGVTSFYKHVEADTCSTPGGCGPGLNLIAQCDPGDVATGGIGYRQDLQSPSRVELTSWPYPDDTSNTAPTGWMVTGNRNYGTSTIVVICADLTP